MMNAMKLEPQPKIHPNSLEIMKVRHLMKDEQGNVIETPAEMFYRVAKRLATEDKKYVKGKTDKNAKVEKTAMAFYKLMAENRFLPGSRVLYEAGNDRDGTGQLSSCFVLPIEDSIQGIFQTLGDAAIVQQKNGGTGFNFSHIRYKGAEVGGTPNVAAGPLHYVKTFSQAFDQILQGKKRGGGNMAILNVNHPDIIDFINLKGKDNSIRNFNISVGITDKFMEAVKGDEPWDLVDHNGKVVKTITAREIFDLIVEKAWECADPGLFFSDTVQNANPTKPLGIIEATNPCGEEPLRAYESCNLGSIVMPTHLKGKSIDWDMLALSVKDAIHFLDNMIDASKFPLERIFEEVKKTRKLGLGVVGLGTLFYQMGIAYDSQEGVDLCEKIIGFIQEESTKESERLAKERGVFPGFKGSKWDEMGRKVRNATMTSIAPTGTLSLVANTSSGIEPIFSLVYTRNSFYQDEGKEERKQLLYVDETFEEVAKKRGFYSEELMKKIADNSGSLHGIDEIPEDVKRVFVVTHDISAQWHVKMQAAAQKNVDAAVSKTINFPNNATQEDVRQAYVMAWELGCKGITIYRDGSKQFQVLESKSEAKDEAKKEVANILHMPEQIEVQTEHVLTSNALQVLEKRALKKNENGEVVETPAQLWRRIASHVAKAEKPEDQKLWEDKFFEVFNSTEFQSGGALIFAGLGDHAILSKCLVLPVDDSIDSIFHSLNMNIEMLKRGVGTGFNFSKIRSTYSKVTTTGEHAAGPIEYLRLYNRAQDTLTGRGGRGLGSMAILNVEHPNIEEFINLKDDLSDIHHYNISVGASDKFMQAVREDNDWDLIDPNDHKVYKTVKARDLFKSIAKHAWVSGDPGMFFLDSAEKGNTTPALGTMDGTNPCGEQPLIPYETCNLGNIDISKMIPGNPYEKNPDVMYIPIESRLKLVNWNRLAEVVKIGVRYLDDIIDVNNYPIKEIEEMTKKTRNIGLGIMGLADFLVKLAIPYDSEDAIRASEEVMSFIQAEAHKYSEELGKEKGNFPAFEGSTWATRQGKKFMRNTRTTTIAPTGTIAIIANCNPGIEPIFALGYRRKNSMGGTDQVVIEPRFVEVAKTRGFYSEALVDEIADGKQLHDLKDKYGIPEDVVKVFKTTHEIDPKQHVRIQAAFQKYVDSAVSKTINLPNSSTPEDIENVYKLAYDLGCKGITVFRDGSKDPALQVGTAKKDSTQPQAQPQQMQVSMDQFVARGSLEPRKRSMVTRGTTTEVKTDQGSLFITINEDDMGVVEIFLNLGKSGSYTAGFTQAIGRLVSMSLRAGIKVDAIIDQLKGIRTSTPTLNRGMIVYSVPDAVAKVLESYIEEKKGQVSMFESQPVVAQTVASATVSQPTVIDPTPTAQIGLQEVKIEPPAVETSNGEEDSSGESGRATVVAEIAPIVETKVETEEHKSNHVDGKFYTKDNTMGDLLECPDCSGDLEYAEGCILCRSCGFSKCG